MAVHEVVTIGRLQAVDLSQVKIYQVFRVLVNETTLHSKAWRDKAKRNNYAVKCCTPTCTTRSNQFNLSKTTRI